MIDFSGTAEYARGFDYRISWGAFKNKETEAWKAGWLAAQAFIEESGFQPVEKKGDSEHG